VSFFKPAETGERNRDTFCKPNLADIFWNPSKFVVVSEKLKIVESRQESVVISAGGLGSAQI